MILPFELCTRPESWTTTKNAVFLIKNMNVLMHHYIIIYLRFAVYILLQQKSFSTMYLLQSVKKTGWLICKIF